MKNGIKLDKCKNRGYIIPTQMERRLFMEKYIESVETLFRLKSEALIPNSDKEHAVILISNIFKNASEHVCVYCQNATKNVFDAQELQNNIQCAVERGVVVKFLTEEDVVPQYLTTLIDENKIFWKKIANSSLNIQHFVEADEKSFRIEEDHETAKAVGCANNSKIGVILHDLFNTMWNMAS